MNAPHLRAASLLLTLLVLGSLAPRYAGAQTLPSMKVGIGPLSGSVTMQLPGIDTGKLLSEDAARSEGGPLRYAIPLDAKGAGIGGAKAAGQWRTLADGRLLWQLALHVPNALSIDVGFERMWLPQGAELYLATADGMFVRGPWIDADNPATGGFWTPIVPGSSAIIELVVPAKTADRVELALATVHAGFRDIFGVDVSKNTSGNCAIDVVCPEGNALRGPIRGSIAFTTGGLLCSGQLVNNTRADRRRLVATSYQCVPLQNFADRMVAYWRYESPTCRVRGTAANAAALPLTTAIPQTGGAVMVATHQVSDFSLVELRAPVPASADAYFLGWDRTDQYPLRTAGISHPQGQGKRIAFDADPPFPLDRSNELGFIAQRQWLVNDWEFGLVEPTALGAGLLDQDDRLIGVYSGGSATCDNNLPSLFGRLGTAWSGGGTSNSRLSDHLAPDGAAVEVLDGLNGCAAPAFAFTAPSEIGAGENAELRVTGIAGQGPYTVEFDVDGDNVVDRRQTGITSNALQLAVYPTASNVGVAARVIDATGCSGERRAAIVVRGPQLEVTPQPLLQLCGDNDADIEPGERWQLPVRMVNTGGRGFREGRAVFANGFPATGISNVDEVGHVVVDDTSGNCPYQFVDIRSQPALALTSVNDGRAVAPLDLGPRGFRLYGQTINQVVMSTNGYLSAGLTDTGGDYDNSCPFSAPDQGSTGARFNVLHDDLVVQPGGAVRRQHFADCPRPSDAPGATGCTVFQWSGLGRNSPSGAPIGSAEFQAILYEGSNQIVYQYRTADDLEGGQAGIGIHDSGASVQLRYACNRSGSAVSRRAVCIFAPGQLSARVNQTPVVLSSPAVNVGSLAPRAEATGAVSFAVPADAGCGRPFALRYVGAVDEAVHAMDGARALFQGRIPDTCQASPTCLGDAPAAPRPQDGQFSSLTRFGNGMTSAVVPRTGAPDQFAGLWFTGTPARTPEWLLVTGTFLDRRRSNQAEVQIQRFTQTAGNPVQRAGIAVGNGQITYLGPASYLFTYNLDNRAGGELMQSLYGTRRPQPERTGIWYAPSEDGWGWAIDDHFRPDNGAPEQVILNYFFDATGRPVWTLGVSLELGGGPMEMVTYQVHCPTCPQLPDFLVTRDVVGSVTRTFSGIGQGTYATDITLRPPLSGTWRRQALPALMITAPAPPQNP